MRRFSEFITEDTDLDAHNAAHLAGLSKSDQRWHRGITKVVHKHGYKEVGTAIVPGDNKMYAHKMYRHPKTGDRIHAYPYHDMGERVIEHRDHWRTGPNATAHGLDSYLSGRHSREWAK